MFLLLHNYITRKLHIHLSYLTIKIRLYKNLGYLGPLSLLRAQQALATHSDNIAIKCGTGVSQPSHGFGHVHWQTTLA